MIPLETIDGPELAGSTFLPILLSLQTLRERPQFAERDGVSELLVVHLDLADPVLRSDFSERFVEKEEQDRPSRALIEFGKQRMPNGQGDLLVFLVHLGREPEGDGIEIVVADL